MNDQIKSVLTADGQFIWVVTAGRPNKNGRNTASVFKNSEQKLLGLEITV